MSRLDVTEKIITAKVAKGLKWSDVAAKVGQSKEWVTAACLGQMTMTAEQAGVVAEIFGLTADEVAEQRAAHHRPDRPHPRSPPARAQ